MITEIRFEVPDEDVAVLDGFCHATEQKRTEVMRTILRQWSDKKLHEAETIFRVKHGVKPVNQHD